MRLFKSVKQDSKTERAPRASARGPAPSYDARIKGETYSFLSSGLTVTGNLESDGEIELHGAVEGEIRSRALTVAEGAQVEGAIFAEEVEIMGSVVGRIEAASVKMTKTAEVVGDIFHHHLKVEPGAFHEGLTPWRPLGLKPRRKSSA